MAQQTINTTPGSADSLPVGGGKINANFAELYGRIFTPNVNPSNTGAVNSANIAAAIAAATAAGGGIIQFGSYATPIPIASSIVPANNVKFRGSGFGVATSGTRLAVSGTVLQGNGTFPAFAYQSVDSGTPYANSSVMAQAALYGCEISDMAADNVAGMIRIGAINQAGAFNGVFKNLYVSYSSDWGFFFDNFQECIIENLENESANNAPGGAYFGASLGSVYSPGNSSLRHIFLQGNSAVNPRGIVFFARGNGTTGSILNDVIAVDVQNNASGVKIVQAATSSNGSANIGVVDSTKFPVGMPVVFSSSSTVTGGAAKTNGFNLYQTYFVVSSAANVIAVSDTVGGAARNATGATAFYVATFGHAGIEIVGDNASSGNLLTSICLYGTDTEGLQTTNVLVQNCAPQLFLSTMTGAQGANVASGICARNIFNGQYNCVSPTSLDFDATASNYFLGFAQFSQVEPLPVVQALQGAVRMPGGLFVDPTNARCGISFGGSSVGESTLIPGSNVQLSSITGPTGTTLYPYAAMMQKQQPYPYGNGGAQLDLSGAICLTGTASFTQTLMQLTNNAAGTQGGNTGLPFEIFNASAFVQTFQPHAGDNFDNNPALTSIAITPGGYVSLRAHYNGTTSTWVVMERQGAYFNADPTTLRVTTGASASATLSTTKVILDGAGTTFALTFPAPAGDGQQLAVLAKSAVSTAFSTVVTAPATTINGTPATLAANTGVAWQYNAASTSWDRLY